VAVADLDQDPWAGPDADARYGRQDLRKRVGLQQFLDPPGRQFAPVKHGGQRSGQTRDDQSGSRRRTGVLGVIAVRVGGAVQAAELALLGERASGITTLTSRSVVVESGEEAVPVAVDGEALVLPVPVVCTIRPGALRVRVPRERPGAPYVAPVVDWYRVLRLAFDRSPHEHEGHDPAGPSRDKDQEQSDD
jgi:hypothetical protein